MRNLKKVLALVLALAMVMTMFAGAISIEAQADDYADLSAAGQDAYDVLNVLGVVTGYTDNTVRGNVPVTRAEAAAFIYRFKTGDVDGTAAFYGDATLPFSDYIADWAKPYVAFANLNGIMVGANGQFRPDDYVTGLEFAKMVLVALGYDATANGFVGSQWAYNVATKATQVGILKGITATLEGAMTRENVMIMLANGIYTDMAAAGTETLGENVFDLLDMNAVLVANDHAAIGAYWADDSAKSGDAYYDWTDYVLYNTTAAGYSRFVYKDYGVNDATQYDEIVIVAAISSDVVDLGKEFRILTTGYDQLIKGSREVRNVYGVIGLSDNATVTEGTRATVKLHDNGTVAVVGGKNMLTDGTYYGYYRSNVDGTIFLNGAAVEVEDVTANTAAAIIGNSTAPVYYVDNNQDSIVDFLSVAKYTRGIVAYIDADGNIQVSHDATATKLAADKNVFTNGDVAVGDMIAFYSTDYNFIKKLDVVTGSVSGYNGSYIINGVAYKLSEIATERAQAFLTNNQWMINAAEYTFITDEDANSHFIVDVKVNTNTKYGAYALVADAVSITLDFASYYNYQPAVRLFTEDGDYEIYNIASINGVTPYQYINMTGFQGFTLNKNDLVSYVVNGTDVHLTTAIYTGTQATNKIDYVNYVAGSTIDFDANKTWLFGVDNKIADLNAAPIFVLNADGEPAVYTTANFYGVTFENGTVKEALYLNRGSLNYVIMQAIVLELADEYIPGTFLGYNGEIVIVTGNSGWTTTETGAIRYTLKTLAPWGGEAPVVYFDSYSNMGAIPAGIYRINKTAENVITDYEKLTFSTSDSGAQEVMLQLSSVSSYYKYADGSMIIYNGTKTIKFADDCVYYYVKKLADGTTVEANDWFYLFGASEMVSAAPADVTISGIYNADGEIAVAIVDVTVPSLS